ncbi:MAG: polysaccharide deacetylase family protein, partial [Christensenellaceae bacterium]|nr:polysaccharide deacetylase family protein [Christensenellaceae bacterium]
PAVTTASHTVSSSYDWYCMPSPNGGQPVLADNADFLGDYPVMAIGPADSNALYLTFDVGYENGNTEKILDILKEKQVPAAFFITGHYLKTNPQLVQRMTDEGHLVCNHTLDHADLSAITDPAQFCAQVDGLADAYKQLTGQTMPPYLRPPEGKYSERSLQLARENGLTMVFWSFAYRDWLNDDQPAPEDALKTVLSRTHPGAILLLHSNSATNASILGQLIDSWRADGYTLLSLDDCAAALAGAASAPSPAA